MEGNTLQPFNDLNGTMPPRGSDTLDEPRNQHFIDHNSSPSHRSEHQPCSTPTKMADLSKNKITPKAKSQANLDPRVAAAELKKKLLKDKSTRAISDRLLGPAGEAPHSTIWPDKQLSSTTATSPAFVPYALPQMPTQNSVDANAEDIAALIKSISSATEPSETKTMGKPADPKASGGSVMQAVGSTGTSSSRNLQTNSIPGLGNAAQIPSSRPTSGAPSRVPSNAKGDETAAGRTSSGVDKAPAPFSNVRTGDGRAKTSKANGNETATSSTSNKPEPTASKPNAKASDRPPAVRLEDKREQGGAINSSVSRPSSRTAHSASSTIGRSGETKNKTDTTRVELNTITGKSSDANEGADTQAVGAALAKLVAEDQDLRDWLVYTQYYDVEARKKKLSRYRALAEMDAAEQRIKEEQERLAVARRKLLEEDDLDRSLLPLIARAGHSETPQLIAPITPDTVLSPETRTTEPNEDDTTLTTPAVQKRCLDTDGTQEPRAKIPKLGTKADKEPTASKAEYAGPPADRERGRDLDRGTSGYHRRSPSFHRGRSPRRQSPSRGPYKKYDPYFGNYGDNNNYDRRDSNWLNTGRYDAYRGDGRRGGWSRTPSPYGRYGRYGRQPAIENKAVDLGGKGETRFFIVKSFNEENVAMCMQDGLWMTQAQNTEIFTSAFARCKNVILFFSINKSRAFQGYARMATAPSPDTPRPRWANSLQWDSSPPFRIDWLSTVEVQFGRISHLHNSLNNDLPVLVGKDGQEIEEECGRRLLEQMGRVIRSENDHAYRDPGPPESPRADRTRGRGGFRIRGRGGSYVKSEGGAW